MVQSLGRYYVRYVNQTYGRSGTLWEGRYKSTLIDSDNYFLVVSRYIELNPVRAQMVKHPAEYPWSSYQNNAEGRSIELLIPHICYLSLGDTCRKRQEMYKGLYAQQIPAYTIKEIRDATNKAWVLGCEKFKQQVEVQTGRRASPQMRGGDRKSEKYKENQLL